ncbi:MAG: hypothetical protein JNK40_14185 [Chromatiales bacterium]|nr:hypothetical protein [Chromatiales bacterium]
MRVRTLCTDIVTVSLALLFCASANAAGEDAAVVDHSRHQDRAGHQMTHEQIEILKSKIEIYRPYTDEQINAAMSRMYEAQEYLSPPGVRNEVGILGLGHGYKAEGDALFKRGYAGVAAVYPTAVGLGMTMMDSAHIQAAVDQLEAAGAKTIVVLPTEVGDNTSLIRQWNYAFGLSDRSSYLDVPRIRSDARILVARTPTTSPLVTQILADYVRGASSNPAGEVVVLIAHGPEDAADNEKELRNLAVHAAGIRAATGVPDVMYGTLQDDAPPEIRQKNVDRMRGWIAGATASGRKVIVVPVVIVGRSGVSARIAKDLADLDYVSTGKGIAEHTLFDQWIRETVAAATKPAGTG